MPFVNFCSFFTSALVNQANMKFKKRGDSLFFNASFKNNLHQKTWPLTDSPEFIVII